MTVSDSIRAGLQELARLAEQVSRERTDDIEAAANATVDALRAGGRLFFAGNGGSAADAQHLAAEYVVRFGGDREALPAIALTTDSSILTAASNDHGFETVFSRQIEALGRRGDVLFLHSTSGESENLILAADAARARGVETIAFLAKGGGRLRERVDHAVVVPTQQTARAQEIHLALGHLICDIVDRAWTGREA
jgi:D-sedoheptulose 7-phosphate isomerase